MNELLTYLSEQLQQNNFFSGGLILMVGGAAVALCRTLPRTIWDWVRSLMFIDVEIPIRDPAFHMFGDWLAKHPYTVKRARWLQVRTRFDRGHTEDNDGEFILSPSYGRHWTFWKRRLMIVVRRKEDGAENKGDIGKLMPNETFHVALMTRNRQLVYDLLAEIKTLREVDDKHVSVYVPCKYGGGDWSNPEKRRLRALETVVLRDGVTESLVNDIDNFLKAESWYIERGIPYRRGYLLYGPPGNGKTSTVMALASHFHLKINVLSLSQSSMDDEAIRNLISSVPRRSLILIEDVDCVFAKRKEGKDKNGNNVTFSGLLNALDGITSSEGHVVVMTTNHIEKLDPALIRPGRCDVRLKIEDTDEDQARRMFLRFFPGATTDQAALFASLAAGRCMAAVQGHLTKNKERLEDALEGTFDEQEKADPPPERTEGELGVQDEQAVGSEL
jgi:chaperone BCS1